jgi:two-component system, OmpR family, response regulator ResD
MATILVVDDEPDVVEIVRTRLERDGHYVISAANGPAAVTNAVNRRPDLILLDIMMPGMDGFEVLRQLKGSHHTARIPVILLTARVEYGARARAWEMYAEQYITKPFDLDVLSRTVQEVLAARESRDAATVAEDAQEEAPDPSANISKKS